MKIQKTKILEYVIHQTEAEIQRLETGLAHAKHAKLEAPGRMQSRYDTMGVEAGWVADSLTKTISEKSEALAILRRFQLPVQPSRVVPGSLVGLGPKDGEPDDFFFVLPVSGGITYTSEGPPIEVLVITPQAPIARGLLGKTLGEEVRTPSSPGGSRLILLLD